MKAYIDINAESDLVHRVDTTPTKEHEITQAHKLVNEEEKFGFGDAGYTDVKRSERTELVKAICHVAMKRSTRKAINNKLMINTIEQLEYLQVSVGSEYVHQQRIIKCEFVYRDTRCRGSVTNSARIVMIFESNNVRLAKNKLVPRGWGHPKRSQPPETD